MRKKSLSPNKRSLSTAINRGTITHQSFSGPIPPPDHLEKYERIQQGFADRIMKMAENQSAHRQECEKKVIKGGIISQVLAQIFAFVICMFVFGSGTYLVLNNKNVEGISTIATTLGGLVFVFIYGKRKQRRELAESKMDIPR